MPRMSSVRRLYLEAHTLAMSELKRSIDAPSDEARPLNYIFLKYERPYQAFGLFKALLREEAPRSIPLLEREERQHAQKQRLRGLDVEGQYEPSFGLVDKAANSFARNQLSRIEWKEPQARPSFRLMIFTRPFIKAL